MRRAILSAVLTVAMVFGGGLAAAHDYKAGDVEVRHPWTRATPPGAQTAGGFLTLHNAGGAPERLLGGRSSVAERVEIHTVSTEDGVMRMRPVGEAGVTVNPGETVALAPGGIHIMLIGLKQPLREGERAPLTLRFEKAGELDVELAIDKPGSRGPGSGNKSMEHAH